MTRTNKKITVLKHKETVNRLTWRSFDLDTTRTLSAAFTCALLICSSRWLNREALLFQKSSSSLGPKPSTSRRIWSDSATSCSEQRYWQFDFSSPIRYVVR